MKLSLNFLIILLLSITSNLVSAEVIIYSKQNSIEGRFIETFQNPSLKYDFTKDKPLCELFPKNNLNFPTEYSHKQVNFKTFMNIIRLVDKTFAPKVNSNGSILKIHAKWTSSDVNAAAYRKNGVYHINMYGGLARHPLMTADGFALVLCHELGHHLAGAPTYPGDWASNEGQADYFATLQCMKQILPHQDRIIPHSKFARKLCNKRYGSFKNKDRLLPICIRSVMAGKTLGTVLASLGGTAAPTLKTKDPSVVSSTMHSHPNAQCRFDTYIAGALCAKNPYLRLTSNPKKHTCGYKVIDKNGGRPFCWYNPDSLEL